MERVSTVSILMMLTNCGQTTNSPLTNTVDVAETKYMEFTNIIYLACPIMYKTAFSR